MVEHVVAQAIGGDGVVDVVLFVCEPVVGKALGAEHEHVAVEQLIVLNDREGSERLAQADAVCEDAAVVGLELVDNGKRCVLLEIVEQVPDFALLEAGPLFCKVIHRDVLEELTEDTVERCVVDQLGRVLAIHCGDGVDYRLGNVLKLARIPGGIELAQVLARHVPRDTHSHGELLAGRCAQGGRRQALDRLERRRLGTVNDEIATGRAIGVPV